MGGWQNPGHPVFSGMSGPVNRARLQRMRAGTVCRVLLSAGKGCRDGRPRFQKLQFRAKNGLSLPKPPENRFKTAKRREVLAAVHMHLDFPEPKGPPVPSDSAMLPLERRRC